MNIPNVRIESGLELRVRLMDREVSLDWSSLQGVKALLYSVEQKAVAGAAEVAIDDENTQILIVKYPGSSPQYTGLAKLIVRCEYNGKQKTYDTAVANFVETTDEATGVIVLDDPTISVGIYVEDVSTSLLDEAINTAFAAAEDAMAAKDNADRAAQRAEEASQILTPRFEQLEDRLTEELARKQDTLIPGNGISIEGNVISTTVGGGVDLSDYAKKADVNIALEKKQDTISDLETIREGARKGATALQSYTESDPIYIADKPSLATKTELATKQDTISDLSTIRDGASKGATALQEHQDISGLATKEEVAGKQNIIADLDSIRSGAAKGATALQSYTETDPVYMADKPSIALKSEIPDISGKADKTAIVTETEGNASYAILPNVLTKLGTLAASVTLSLDTSTEESGVTNIYDIIFITPTNAPSITWPEGISWVGGSAPAIAGGKTYEVSIMDNLATYGEF